MKKTIQEFKATLKSRPVLFLAAAALFHISVTAVIFTVGKYRLMPAQFRANGLGEFASDGFFYQEEVAYLVTLLKNHDLAGWATWPTQLHLRLYSLPLAAVSHWTGFSVLTIEPVNLLYYLAILGLVFRLGKEIFDYRAGLLAATIVAVWPSLLLHTTQLLRDPLLMVAVLGLVLVITIGLKRDYAWHRGMLMGLFAVLALVVIRIVRLSMWDLTCTIVWFGTLLLLVRMLREKRIQIGNVGLAAIMIAAVFITPLFQPAFRNQQAAKGTRVILAEEVQKLPLVEQMARRRDAFGRNSVDIGSRTDTAVRFSNLADIIRYVPRGAVVGFFAPFPNMWLASGTEVGRSGRVLCGLETLLTYGIECFALAGLWRARRQFASWLLVFALGVGILALGLVVKNIGALYRLRYSFWILIVVLGAGGAMNLFKQKSSGAFSANSQAE